MYTNWTAFAYTMSCTSNPGLMYIVTHHISVVIVTVCTQYTCMMVLHSKQLVSLCNSQLGFHQLGQLVILAAEMKYLKYSRRH